MLISNEFSVKVFSKQDVAYWKTIQELYRQQEQMYRTRTNSIENRIVSIHQPFICPFVRGKDGKKVEIGSKINVNLVNGYTCINQFSFNASNDSTYLKDLAEVYMK